MQSILEGLDFMKDMRVIHRDLKPGNILFKLFKEPNGQRLIEQVKIADFGLSRQVSFDSIPLSPRISSLPYRPPEILMGD